MRSQSRAHGSTEPEDQIRLSLGALIRAYRLRQRQIHNGQAWSQEDLAVAIGSDKSHINRIERGHQLPAKSTLVRICDALGLSWNERSLVLSVAGFMVEAPAPTHDDIRAVIEQLRPTVLAANYSMSVHDTDVRLWELNDIVAYTFLGYAHRREALHEVQGLRNMDLLLEHPVGDWWRRVMVNFDQFARRHLAQFRRVFRCRQHLPEYQAIVERIGRDPRVYALWKELMSDGHHAAAPDRVIHDEADPRFLDHQRVILEHPVVGRFTVQIWNTSLIIDDRFVLTHLMPNDARTQSMFLKVKQQLHQASVETRGSDGPITRTGQAAALHRAAAVSRHLSVLAEQRPEHDHRRQGV